MTEKRATDHLEPAAKKRGSERQITKDDASDEDVEARVQISVRLHSLLMRNIFSFFVILF